MLALPLVAWTQGLPPGTDLVVSDVTAGPPGARDAVTIAVDLDRGPLGNTTISATGADTDTPGHLATTPAGDVLLTDLEADPSGLGADPAGGLGRGGVFSQDTGTRSLVLRSDGTRCNPVVPGCGPAGVFVDPRGIAWSPSLARSFVVDPEADPSLLGPDRFGGAAHGAVFLVDAAGGVSLVADGTNLAAGFPGTSPAFDEPVAAALGADGTLYVVDARADPLGLGWRGAVFAVDTTTGMVSLAVADAGFRDLRDVAVESTGSLLLLDGAAGGNGEVLRAVLAPPPNIVSRVGSALFADLRAIVVAPGGLAYVVDAAADPAATGAGGAVFRVDVDASGVSVVSSTADFRDPTGIDLVSVPMPQDCGTSPGDTLRVARSASFLELSWRQPSGECGETFRIRRGDGSRPPSPPSFPIDPAYEDVTAQDADGDAANGSALLRDAGRPLAFYLVTRVHSDGSEGPVGAYGL